MIPYNTINHNYFMNQTLNQNMLILEFQASPFSVAFNELNRTKKLLWLEFYGYYQMIIRPLIASIYRDPVILLISLHGL